MKYLYLDNILFTSKNILSSSLGDINPVSNFIFGVRKLSSGKIILNKHGSPSSNQSLNSSS